MGFRQEMCKLCEYLHKHEGEERVVERMDRFWSRDKYCIKPKDFYQDIAREVSESL